MKKEAKDYVFWVEVTEKDFMKLKLRGIEITAAIGDTKDKVVATGVWATRTNFWTEAKPGANQGDPKLLQGDVNDKEILATFKEFHDSDLGMGVFHPARAIGRDKKPLPNFLGIGGREEQEFTLWPVGIGKESDVTIDMSRQVAERTYAVQSFPNKVRFQVVLPPLSVDFPTRGWNSSEMATDDPPVATDEDNTPTNDHVYQIDSPSFLYNREFGHVIRRLNFNEYVRMKFGPGASFSNAEKVNGSRASELAPWHLLLYVKRGPGNLDLDNTANSRPDAYVFDNANEKVTVSTPRFVGAGNGTLTVQVNQGNAGTDAWRVQYDKAKNSFALDSWNEMQRKYVNQGVVNEQNGKWSIQSNDGKISVVVSQGMTPFSHRDGFVFSTFKSQAGRANEIKVGHIDITAAP